MALSELHSGSRAKAPGAPVTARGVNGRFAPAEAPGREAGANRGGNADFPPPSGQPGEAQTVRASVRGAVRLWT